VCALIADIPELLALQTQPAELRVSSHLFIQCAPSWSAEFEIIFLCVKVLLLYSLPLVLMTVAYWQIVRVLWRSDAIPGHSEIASSSATLARETSSMSEYNNTFFPCSVDARSRAEFFLSMPIFSKCLIIDKTRFPQLC
jgi:hypocretin (orexin) receptor 2